MPTSSSKKRRTNGPIKWVLAMRMLLSPRSIALKAPRGLSQKLRGHAEVALGSGHVDVAKVGRQQGEARLHINPLSVLGDDPVDGHRVPQVMEAGLPPIGRRSHNAGMLTQTPKDFFKLLAGHGAPSARGKKRRVSTGRLGQGLSRCAVGFKCPAQHPAYGDDP